MKTIRSYIAAFLIVVYSFSIIPEVFSKESEETINFGFIYGIFNEVNINDAKVTLKIWAENNVKAISKRKNKHYKINVKIYNSIDEICMDLNDKNIDILTLSSLDYIKIRKKTDLLPLVLSTSSITNLEKDYLLVKSNSSIKSIKEIRNKELCIVSGSMGEISKLWLENLLIGEKIGSNGFFSKITEHKNSSQGIISVFLGKADACIIDKSSYLALIEMNPKFKNGLKIIAESSSFALGLTCMRKSFTELEQKELIDISLKMKNDIYGNQIFKIFKISGLCPFSQEALHYLESLFIENEKFKKGILRK